MNNSLQALLKNKFGVSDDDYTEAARLRAEKGGSISEVLLRRKVLSETQLLDALSEQYGIPFWPELPLESFGEDRTRNAPISFLKRHAMVPLVLKNIPASSDSELPEEMVNIIAVNDPSAFQPLDDLARMIGFSAYNLVLSTKSAIFAAINLIFDLSQGTAEQLVQHMEEDGSTIISEIEDTADLLEDTSDAPIIKLVNHIISQSIKARSSDIHIEPYQDSFKVRYRVDGILYDLLTPPKWIQPALISRIKVMAKLNIAEKRLPQDGRLEVKIGSQNVDVRVSTLPTTFGERVVMRLLNKSEEVLNLREVGLSPEELEQFNKLVNQPNGIILVTGPTGSGKTTTLYS
ncbi:MAG: ATPase, T2SS/T4P/T4SS family, partial [Desulfosarcina sp.]